MQLFSFALIFFFPCSLTSERKNDLISLYQNLANVDQCEAAYDIAFSCIPNHRFSCSPSEMQQVKH